MSKYVDLDKAITIFDTRGRKIITTVFQILDRNSAVYETADVVEQKHGKWKKAYLDHEAFGIRPTVVYCSECNLVGYWEPKYCPNCGARMVEE